MPSKKSCTSKSSNGTSLSVQTSGTPFSGKSMDAIAKAVTASDSRLDAWKNGSCTDDPFVFGYHGGQHIGERIWDLNNKLFDFDKMYKSGSTTKRS